MENADSGILDRKTRADSRRVWTVNDPNWWMTCKSKFNACWMIELADLVIFIIGEQWQWSRRALYQWREVLQHHSRARMGGNWRILYSPAEVRYHPTIKPYFHANDCQCQCKMPCMYLSAILCSMPTSSSPMTSCSVHINSSSQPIMNECKCPHRF